MATVSANLTNLKNTRVAIINKLNEVQETSIPLTTTLSELTPYIEGGGKLDYSKLNVIKLDCKQFTWNGTYGYSILTIPRSGFLSISCVVYNSKKWVNCFIHAKIKTSTDDIVGTWPKVSQCHSGNMKDAWETTNFHSFVSKGNQFAIVTESSHISLETSNSCCYLFY